MGCRPPHRAVEAAAGVSHGTTTYYFGSRQNIVDATLEYLAERDSALAEQARGAATASPSPGSFDVDRVADLLVALVAGEQCYQLARYELMLGVARRPELRPSLARWRMSFVARIEAMLTPLGTPNPNLVVRWWVAALDGLLLDELSASTAVPGAGQTPDSGHARATADIPALSDLDGTDTA